MEPKQNKMGIAPITPLLLTMALPAMLSMIIQALYNVVDSIYVSRISSQALSAISLVFPIQTLMVAINVGTSVGLNSLVARRLGEQKQKEANEAAAHGIVLAVINGLAIAVLGIFGARAFFSMSTDNPTIIEMGITYTRIVTGLCIFSSIQACIEKLLQATGNMVYPMISHVIGCITNIILDPILIFGYFGLPAMGITGAAVATVAGQALGMIFCILMLVLKSHAVDISFKNFRLKGQVIKDIYQVGFPAIIMQAISSFLVTFLNMILINFSEIAVNVLGIYFKLQSFVFMPVFGLTQGAMPVFGYNFGAGNKKRLIKAIAVGTAFAAGIMIIGTVIFQVFPEPMLMLFNADAETLSIGIRAMRTLSLCFIPAALGVMFSTVFQAVGSGFNSLLLSLIRQLICILPVAYMLAKISLDAVWFAFPIAEGVAFVVAIIMYIHLYRTKIADLEPLQLN